MRRTNRQAIMESWEKIEELLSPFPTFPPAINALNHSALIPHPPAEALKRLTRLDETKGDNNIGGETWVFPITKV